MEMTNNPYQTPEGQLTTDDQGFGEIKFFSPSTRIGRMRYLSHGFLFTLVSYLVLAIGVALALGVSAIFWVIVAVAYIAIIVFSVILMIQRLHDLNKSGWMCLILFIPLVNFFFLLYVIFAPGTKGANNYGLQPPPNKTWNWVLGIMMTVVPLVIGILAAVALPAYQDYVERAQGISTEYSDDYYQYDGDADNGYYYDESDVEASDEFDYSDYSDE